MKLTLLRLQDFRNYADQTLNFTEDRVILCGANGTGKTNVLEAIALLSVGKSWREHHATDLITEATDSAQITGHTADQNHWQVQIGLRQRRFLKNDKAQTRARFLGQIPTLVFCPEYLHLLTGPKSPRVTFFDRFLVQSHPEYREALLKAHKAHKQKTALLRSLRHHERDPRKAPSLLAPWNQMLAETMPVITSIRRQALEELNPHLQQAVNQVAPTVDPIELRLSSAEDIAMETTAILDWFTINQSQEIAAAKNFIAPHRDDFVFFLRDRSLGATASRGETRTVLLALLTAQKYYLHEKIGCQPILLLDDVFSELDDHRQAQLESLCEGSQTFFTTTHPEHFDRFSQAVQVFTTPLA